MKAQWIGVTGAMLILTALVLGTLGPRLLPNAFWGTAPVSLNGPSMMGNGMMGGGMMGSGMMNGGMMGAGMMNRDQMRQMMGTNVDVDRMFLQMMIPHHQAAIGMAQQALKQAEHPEIKTLAQSIVTTQQAEIVEMQGYLRDWYGVQGQ